jgi:glutaredoxin 3
MDVRINPRSYPASIKVGDRAVISVEDDPPEIIDGRLGAADFSRMCRYIALNRGAILDHWAGRIDGVELARALWPLPTSRPRWRKRIMPQGQRKKIEIYSAGCRLCREAEAIIRRIVGANYDIEILDMRRAYVAREAARRGIRSVPAVAVDGHLAACITDRGVDEAVLRSAIAGLPQERD